MWSDRYYYLNIYKNESLDGEISTKTLQAFIKSIPELVEEPEGLSYRNNNDFPFIHLELLKVKNVNSWSSNDKNKKTTNFIAIVCEKGNGLNKVELFKVCIQLAFFLNWTLVDECTDHEAENFVIWKAENNNL